MTFVVPQLPAKATTAAAAVQRNGDNQETQERTSESSASASLQEQEEAEGKKADDSVFAMPTAPVKRASTSASVSMPSPPPPLFPKDQQQKEASKPSSAGMTRVPSIDFKLIPKSTSPKPDQDTTFFLTTAISTLLIDAGRTAPQQQQQQPSKPSGGPSGPPPNAPPLKYQKPAWSGYPNQQFFFEVIKNGIVVDKIQAPLKEFLTIGRLPMCDLEMEHPVSPFLFCFPTYL
jgi:hypothetical protein